jgi:fused signal recognition particle receptor
MQALSVAWESLAVAATGSMWVLILVAGLMGIAGLILVVRKKRASNVLPAEHKASKEISSELTSPRDSATDAEPPATLRAGLDKTRREGFIAKLDRLLKGRSGAGLPLDELEETLLTADIGVRTAERLFACIKEGLNGSDRLDTEQVWALLRKEAHSILDVKKRHQDNAPSSSNGPRVIMLLGVNGSGKTTTIGKLAHLLQDEGKRVSLIAGDTFRAAAAEQLEHWGRRVGSEVFRGKEGADPASVVFDGIRHCTANGSDVILVDTAGRLHTHVNLMEELRKVRRVMGKAVDDAPHEVLLVLDATTGQNAIQQAKQFDEATDLTGIVLTKLDGTAKGGIIIGVCDQLGVPVSYVGVGERVADLRVFDSAEFVDALFSA